MVIRNEISIRKPAGKVWEFLDNTGNTGMWQSGFCSYKHLSGTRGYPGAEALWVYEEAGRTVMLRERTVKTAPPTLYHGLFEHELITVEMKTCIEEVDRELSRVCCELQIRFNSPSVETVAPYMLNVFHGRQERDLQALKQVLEAV